VDNDTIWEAKKSIEYTFEKVAERGWQDTLETIDRFAELRKDKRFREAQVAALYEQYFLPERHEFEWRALNEIADVVIESQATAFVGGAITTGIIGDLAYDLLTQLAAHAAFVMSKRLEPRGGDRAQGFLELSKDIDRIRDFFSETKKARIKTIEEETGIPRERIYPIVKLAGLNHYRRGDPCYWEIPDA
jgi:hypothetical protein